MNHQEFSTRATPRQLVNSWARAILPKFIDGRSRELQRIGRKTGKIIKIVKVNMIRLRGIHSMTQSTTRSVGSGAQGFRGG
jgi:hypothetical protein